MKTLREILRCLRSASYPNHIRAMEAMRIARMYGACSRMENCRICGDYHIEFIEPERPRSRTQQFVGFLCASAVALAIGFLMSWWLVPGAF